MSLITCCPACGTLFKVVADQLRVSEGWVRCGHCAEIFDATAHMQQGPAVPPPPAAPPVPPQAALDPAPAPAPVQAAPVAAEPQPLPPAEEEIGYPPFELRRMDVDDALAEPAEPDAAASDEPSPAKSQDPGDAPALEDLSFLRQARRRAFWRRPLVRATLVLVALVLACLLAAQYAVHQRDRLAAAYPQLRPILAALCRPVDCRLGPWRSIEAIVIDSSTFNKLRPDLYRLSFTLRNESALPVAAPALELTLTDTQDQPVMRRVLPPQEYGAGTQEIAASGEWSGSIALSVSANGSTGRIVGYRLLAFYP